MGIRKLPLMFALIVPVILTGGKCVFVAKSGDSSSDNEDKQDANLIIIVGDGQFIDAPVQGMRYISGAVSGITGINGEFHYEIGRTIGFYIGDIPLGKAVQGKAFITPLDLVEGGTADSSTVINISRFLQSLDSVPGDGRITLPENLHASAVKSNQALFSSIEHLDFGDGSHFDNNASQIVATLTIAYPFTAHLVDAETARKHLLESLSKWQLGEFR